MPIIKDWVYVGIAVNSLILALVTDKTLDWRLGEGLRDMMTVAVMILGGLIISLALRLL